MYRTPQDDGEEVEHQVDQEKPQRRKRAAPEQQSDLQYYGEEEPQHPKIRRASLHLDPATISPSTSAKLARIEKPLHHYSSSQTAKEKLSETSTRMPRVERPRPVGRAAPRLTPPERRRMIEEEEEPTTNRIMVAQRKRKAVYEPPISQQRTRPKGAQSRPPIRYPQQKHRRPLSLVLIGSGIVLLLILLPLIAHNILVQPRTSSSIITNGGTHIGSVPIETGQKALDTSHDLVIVPPNSDHPAPPVYATSAYLLDADTGQVLYAHNAFMHLPMLSTTKLMTAALASEMGNLNQKITITPAIANDLNQQLSADSSVMGVKKGETYTLRDLLYGLFLVSGNDAAIVIADGLSGNLPTFVARMNARAAQLGMHDTHYMNPHGLLMNNHYSSAHDLAIIGKFTLGIPAIHQISGTREYIIPQTGEHATHDLINGNQFLWWYPGVDAGKPGYDGVNDFIQVISVVRNNHHLIGVTMNTADWWTDMRDLMNWGFNSYTWVSPRTTYLNNQPIPYAADWNYFVKDQPTNAIPIGNQGRYYIASGYSISGLLLTYFDKNEGLKKFGYPEGPVKAASSSLLTQKFVHGNIQCDLTTQQCKAG